MPSPQQYMQLALEQAKKSPPKPTNYCVGAVLVDEDEDKVLSTGYTLELPGNTHAEQCCLQKLADQHGLPEERVVEILPPHVSIYTTMEPCVERLSGNLPCAQRILRQACQNHPAIQKVYTGVQEPATFVRDNASKTILKRAGIEYIHVSGFEDEILAVATAGHVKAG